VHAPCAQISAPNLVELASKSSTLRSAVTASRDASVVTVLGKSVMNDMTGEHARARTRLARLTDPLSWEHNLRVAKSWKSRCMSCSFVRIRPTTHGLESPVLPVTAFDQVAPSRGLRQEDFWLTVQVKASRLMSRPEWLAGCSARVLKQSGYGAAEAA
jgi:hypothetical protein